MSEYQPQFEHTPDDDIAEQDADHAALYGYWDEFMRTVSPEEYQANESSISDIAWEATPWEEIDQEKAELDARLEQEAWEEFDLAEAERIRRLDEVAQYELDLWYEEQESEPDDDDEYEWYETPNQPVDQGERQRYSESEKEVVRQQLIDVATARDGFELQPERLERLLDVLQRNWLRGFHEGYSYNELGLRVHTPVLVHNNEVSENVSIIDFMPTTQEDEDNGSINGRTYAQRGQAARFTVMGIEAFQDFVILADAGLVEKPEKFSGYTNETMAIFAKRAGFEMTKKHEDDEMADVKAAYETVASRVFSPKIISLHQRMTDRLAEQASRADQAALAA